MPCEGEHQRGRADEIFKTRRARPRPPHAPARPTMIQTDRFIWLHLPRTGGTTTRAAMHGVKKSLPRSLRSGWIIDDDGVRAKHDNLAIRAARLGAMPQAERIAMNFRPLGEWLTSNWKWTQANGLSLPIERYQDGEFFSLRVGAWCRADWWLSYFEIERVTDFIRLDHLDEDLRGFLTSIDPRISLPKVGQLNRLGPSPSIQTSAAARAMNPKWSALEDRLWPEGG